MNVYDFVVKAQKAIPILVNGMKAEDIAEKLSGVTCGRRPTSCGDQLAKAVLAAKKAEETSGV